MAEDIKTILTFDYDWFRSIPSQKRKQGNQSSSQKFYYKDIVTAFDIETSTIPEIQQAVMYIWQWQFGDKCTVIGRTWYDFTIFLKKLRDCMDEDQRLFIAVHNLSFEFQFLAGIYPFDTEEVFALDHRKVVRCSMYDQVFEFRCSYIHSNMSLSKYLKAVGVEHEKLEDYDYSKVRYWWTDLSDFELRYCIHDVKGLVEAIQKEMEKDGDNLYTWPLTSTGYVRRDIKHAMRKVRHLLVKEILPDYDVYKLLREEFRGGNTHANRYYVSTAEWDIIVEDGKAADRSSSYPDEVMNKNVPMSRFFYQKDLDLEGLMDLINRRHRAVVFRCRLFNVRLQDPTWPVPYISKSKCRALSTDAKIDNGRVLSCSWCDLTINDIDLDILLQEYDFDMEVHGGAHARYGPLPDPIREVCRHYYERKTALKGIDPEEDPDSEYFLNKFKNKLNSIYGCMAQDPVKVSILFEGGRFRDDFEETDMTDDEARDAFLEELLEKHNYNTPLAYQWGCWITAWARHDLEWGIRASHEQSTFLYCDTDSVWYLGDVDFTEFNSRAMAASKASGAYATDHKGNIHYMGVFEPDKVFKRFKTLGAKKYAYEDADGLHITIAGVNKKKGAEELAAAGGLEVLKDGFTFHEAGGTESVYNDEIAEKRWRNPDGDEVYITRNVVIRPTTKTIGLTQEYKDLLQSCRRVGIDV